MRSAASIEDDVKQAITDRWQTRQEIHHKLSVDYCEMLGALIALMDAGVIETKEVFVSDGVDENGEPLPENNWSWRDNHVYRFVGQVQ